MNLLHEVHEMHGIRLTRARRAAALVDPAGGATFTQDHCAPGQGVQIMGMTDLDTRHIGDRFIQNHLSLLSGIQEMAVELTSVTIGV